MISCIIGSIIGTLLGLLGSYFVAEWRINALIKKVNNLIEEANTFKITLKNEI